MFQKMEKEIKSCIQAKVLLRPAKAEDFTFKVYGEVRKKIGLPYFLKNSKGDLECYHLSDSTRGDELREFIKDGRCYLLENQHPGAGKMIEIL